MKIPNRFYSLTAVIVVFSSLTSCGLSDQLDKLNSIKTVEGTASFNANLLNQTWLLKDFIPSDQLQVKEQVDGSYNLGFETSSNYVLDKVMFPVGQLNPTDIPLTPLNLLPEYTNTSVGSYFEMPPFNIDVQIPKPSIGDTSFSSDFKIEYIKLRTGAKVSLTLDINSNSGSFVTIEIPSLTKNGVVYKKDFGPIEGSQTTTLVMNDLDGYLLSTDPQISLVIKHKIRRISSPIMGNIKATFSLDIADHYENIQGFFGEMSLSVDAVEVPISISDLIKGTADSEMVIKEAVVTIGVSKSGFTIPTDLDFTEGAQCYYINDNVAKPITITQLSGVDPDTYIVKINNLNVLNIEKIVFHPKVTLNKGLTSGNNFITDSATVNYTVNAEVPLDVKAKGLMFETEDDNPFTDVTLDDEDFQVQNGQVLVKGSVSSEIPLGAKLQVFYRNISNDNTYLSPLFEAPITITNGTTSFETIVTKAKLDVIKQYPYQVLQLTLDGSGAIKSTQKITFKVGVAARATVKAKV